MPYQTSYEQIEEIDKLGSTIVCVAGSYSMAHYSSFRLVSRSFISRRADHIPDDIKTYPYMADALNEFSLAYPYQVKRLREFVAIRRSKCGNKTVLQLVSLS
jgi:hypothetical protein